MHNIYSILKKELRSYFNLPIAYIVISVFLLITGWYFLSQLFLINQADLRIFLIVAPMILVFFAPAISMRLISEEKKTKSLELLVTMPLKDREVVLGKYLASLALLGFSLLLTFPYPLTLALLGNLDQGQIIGGYLGVFLVGASFLAIGLFCSSLTSNQIVAFIIGFAITFSLFMFGKILPFIPQGLLPLLEFLGIDSHFENLAKGVIDSRDLLYFFSIIIFSIALANYFLGSRKWK